MAEVVIPTARGEMRAHLAAPTSTGRVPGVVVIHDAGGMTRDHHSQADWLAEAGFLAVALNLYHRGGLLLCARTIMRDVATRSGPTFDDIEAARAWLAAQPGCNGRVVGSYGAKDPWNHGVAEQLERALKRALVAPRSFSAPI